MAREIGVDRNDDVKRGSRTDLLPRARQALRPLRNRSGPGRRRIRTGVESSRIGECASCGWRVLSRAGLLSETVIRGPFADCWGRGHRGQPASRRPRAIVSAGLLLVLVHRLASATSFPGPRRGGLRRDRWRLGTIKDRRSFLKERCHRFLGVRGSNSRGEFLVLDLYRLLDLPTHRRLQQSLAGL
jgi:hypothetical protein